MRSDSWCPSEGPDWVWGSVPSRHSFHAMTASSCPRQRCQPLSCVDLLRQGKPRQNSSKAFVQLVIKAFSTIVTARQPAQGPSLIWLILWLEAAARDKSWLALQLCHVASSMGLGSLDRKSKGTQQCMAYVFTPWPNDSDIPSGCAHEQQILNDNVVYMLQLLLPYYIAHRHRNRLLWSTVASVQQLYNHNQYLHAWNV